MIIQVNTGIVYIVQLFFTKAIVDLVRQQNIKPKGKLQQLCIIGKILEGDILRYVRNKERSKQCISFHIYYFFSVSYGIFYYHYRFRTSIMNGK